MTKRSATVSYLCLCLGLEAACRYPEGIATTVTQAGIAKLRYKMTENEVFETLGPPLARGTFTEGGVDRETFTYAYPSKWHLGSRSLWTGGGKGFVVTLQKGLLETAVIADAGVRGGLCACTRDSCPDTWADECLKRWPPRAAP